MTDPKHTDTSRIGDLVERLRREIVFRDHGDGRKTMMRLNSDGDEAADRIEALEAENEHLKRQLSQIAWLAQRPYDPDEQLTGGEGCASKGQAGSEA